MFLNLLTDAQKASFLALATKVTMADGGVVESESTTIDIRRFEMGGDISAPPEEIFGEPNFTVFDTRQAQCIALMELYVIAYSDDKFHPDERPILEQLVEAWGFSAEETAAMEQWGKTQAPVSLAAWALIEELGATG